MFGVTVPEEYLPATLVASRHLGGYPVAAFQAPWLCLNGYGSTRAGRPSADCPRPTRSAVPSKLSVWMQTIGACQVGISSAGSQRCLRSCMREVVRPCCCTFCCTKLTLKCQGSSVRLPPGTLARLAPASSSRRQSDTPSPCSVASLTCCDRPRTSGRVPAGCRDCHSVGHSASPGVASSAPSARCRRPKAKYDNGPTPAELSRTTATIHIRFGPRIWLAGQRLMSMRTAI